MSETFEIWPGPMEGVMSPEFLRAANGLRLTDRWMTPFLRLSASLPSVRKLKSFIGPFLPEKFPVTLQLMGVDGVLMGRCGTLLADLGAREINLNFGCPSRRVVNGGAGGGALRKPDTLLRTLETVRNHLPPDIPLSVKLRAGWNSIREMEYLLPRLGEAGAGKIFFHCRTVEEAYRPIPDRMERFQRAAALCRNVPLVLNGGIEDPQEKKVLSAIPGVCGIMIARAWMRDPWLLRRFAGASELPPVQEGRKLFARTLHECGVRGGAEIELNRMIWGEDNPRWRVLLTSQAAEEKTR